MPTRFHFSSPRNDVLRIGHPAARSRTVAFTLVLLALVALTARSAQSAPNVIVLLADDQGYGDLGRAGNQFARTPNLDRLATESTAFNHFYVTPVCATTRASFLTGRLFPETGAWGVHLARDYLRPGETTIGEVFQQAGYATGFMGKWHSGKHEPWLPWNRGFDDAWMASLYVHENNTVSHNGRAEHWPGWTTDRLADHAIDYIQAHTNQPFLLYVAFLSPHEPWQAPAALVKTYQDRGLSKPLATVFAMNELVDTNVGRILETLDRSGLATNTIVVYFSDNGPIGESSNLGRLTDAEMAVRNPAGLRGVKGNIWDNAIRVPCFIRWPGQTKAREISDVVHVTDLLPTLADLAGITLVPQPGRALDGRTFRSLLDGRAEGLPARDLVLPYWEARWPEYNSGVLTQPGGLDFTQQIIAVRTPQWKWVQAWGKRELFDMNADPCETNDLTAQQDAEVERFSAEARSWFASLQQDGRAYRQPRFPIGRVLNPIDEVAETRNVGEVPGFSAVNTTGHVVVKTHWSEGWQAAGDSQTMLIEIRDPGRYRVEVETTGPTPEAVLALQAQGRRVEGKLGANKVSTLGEITLDQGQTEMTLEAVSLPVGKPEFMQKLWGVRFVFLSAQ